MTTPNSKTKSPSTPAPSSSAIKRLRNICAFIFDMDGTLVLGDKTNHGLNPLPGAREMIAHLNKQNLPYVLFTNGTALTPVAYVETLRRIGFDLPGNAVLTPASVAADLFVEKGYRRILALGTEGMTKSLADAGLEILKPEGKPTADAVLIGWFREFTMPALESACYAAWNGAKVYSCSQSLFFATAEGKTLGTSRAIAAMIRDLTGAKIHLVGKPDIAALRCASYRLNVATKHIAVVGDDPALEVPMAHRGKSLAIAVQTGIGAADSFKHLKKSQHPHIAIHDVGELLSLYIGQNA
jgi:HAD superfamily hydrolase (TIGR01450 family)